ncbi:hypothetical protein GW17_00040585 [Ensete ventricosum]|nr:hypothetical protein GW17_00040585 [Ensete ventricosum]RZS23900.1 hypothetical protein BHM03_00056911 [Ensete ventricosum]
MEDGRQQSVLDWYPFVPLGLWAIIMMALAPLATQHESVVKLCNSETLAMFTRLRCKEPYHERVESTEDKLGGGGEAEMSRVPSIALTTALFHNFPSRVSAAAHEKWSGKRNRHAESTEEQVT